MFQNLLLNKEERSAKITFKTTVAAENFKKKFNNKMVAASRLSVTLRWIHNVRESKCSMYCCIVPGTYVGNILI